MIYFLWKQISYFYSPRGHNSSSATVSYPSYLSPSHMNNVTTANALKGTQEAPSPEPSLALRSHLLEGTVAAGRHSLRSFTALPPVLWQAPFAAGPRAVGRTPLRPFSGFPSALAEWAWYPLPFLPILFSSPLLPPAPPLRSFWFYLTVFHLGWKRIRWYCIFQHFKVSEFYVVKRIQL